MKKSIMIDMDDVICNGGFEGIINEFLGTNYTSSDFGDYYMQNIVPEERRKEFFEFFKTKNLYEYTSLAPDAYEVIEWLNERYDVYIGTSYLIPEILEYSGKMLLNKFQHLTSQLPFLDPYKFVFLGIKKILNCDYKIDDKLENLENAKKKFLFNAFHNQKISDEQLKEAGVIRVSGFAHIKEILSKEDNIS